MRKNSLASIDRRRSVEATAADDALAKMGYKAELPRSLSMLSVLGLSFAIGMNNLNEFLCIFKQTY